VVPALKQSRAEELREEIASSITTFLQTPAKPVLPLEEGAVISPSRLMFPR
jgi:hypothetical protein